MSKISYSTGNPVFNQLLNFIPKTLVTELVSKLECDKYYKTFKTYDHLVTMLYSSFHKCESLREVISGMQVSYTKLLHLGLKNLPKRSTLSEANRHRNVLFFEQLYLRLYKLYYSLPDSQSSKLKEKRVFILDSTTITLFSDVMKGAGSNPSNGKKKVVQKLMFY